MNNSPKATLFIFNLFISFLTLPLVAQDYAWELVPTQETNKLVTQLITDQGHLVASGNGLSVSRDQGITWDTFSEVPRFNQYVAIGDQVILGTWNILAKVDLAQGTYDTIATFGGSNFHKTDNGNIGFISRRNYTVVDTDGNLISQDTITSTGSIFVRDIFIETGFPSYILRTGFSGYMLNEISDEFLISSNTVAIPESVNNKYFYANGIFYSSQSYSRDGGVTWIDYNLPSTAGPVKAHTVHNDILYIVDGESLFISLDQGATFVERVHNEQFTGRVQVYVNNGLISISSESRRDNKILNSVDEGNSWALANGIFSGTYNGVAANSQGIALSIHNEEYFFNSDNFFGIEALENDRFIIAEPNEFCISADGQAPFQCTDFTFFEFFYGISIKKDKVYVSSFSNIMVSDNDGESFQLFNSNNPNVGELNFFNAYPPLAFFDNNKFIFTDEFGFSSAGNSFILFDLATESGIALSKEFDYDLFQDIETAFSGSTVYILEFTDAHKTELSLLTSNDEGLNFTPQTLNIPNVTGDYQLLTDHNGHLIIYSGNQIWINQNQGADWVDISPGLDLSDDVITDITVSFDDAIYVSLRNGGIFKLACMISDPLAEDCITPLVDLDNDGYFSDVDCDDNNADINPGSPETCNGLDDNCDDIIDEGLTLSQYYRDQDGDGYGIESVSLEDCQLPAGFAVLFGDCDDTSADVNPDAEEIPNNGIDEDCDGLDLTSSLHALSNATIDLYPNPVVDIINIAVTGQLDYQATLYNLEGQLIRTAHNALHIKVNGLTSGVYLLEIKDLKKNQQIIERIIVE